MEREQRKDIIDVTLRERSYKGERVFLLSDIVEMQKCREQDVTTAFELLKPTLEENKDYFYIEVRTQKQRDETLECLHVYCTCISRFYLFPPATVKRIIQEMQEEKQKPVEEETTSLKTVNINEKEIVIKEYKGERVVTFKDIDLLHQRPLGTARKRFYDNQEKFVEYSDYFFVKAKDVRTSEFRTSEINNLGTYLITEQGYLMLVKSFTDELAWKVQRQLVSCYFRQQEQKRTPVQYMNKEIRYQIDLIRQLKSELDTRTYLQMLQEVYRTYQIPDGYIQIALQAIE